MKPDFVFRGNPIPVAIDDSLPPLTTEFSMEYWLPSKVVPGVRVTGMNPFNRSYYAYGDESIMERILDDFTVSGGGLPREIRISGDVQYPVLNPLSEGNR